jgi:hypothetical protein
VQNREEKAMTGKVLWEGPGGTSMPDGVSSEFLLALYGLADLE